MFNRIIIYVLLVGVGLWVGMYIGHVTKEVPKMRCQGTLELSPDGIYTCYPRQQGPRGPRGKI